MSDIAQIFVDGSCLIQDIIELRKKKEKYLNRKVDLSTLVRKLHTLWNTYVPSKKTVTFYFRKDYSEKENYIIVSKEKYYWVIKECGITDRSGLSESKRAELPDEFRDVVLKREKGVDAQIITDALLLALRSNMEEFIFYFNDRDFIPMIGAIRTYGLLAYVTRISNELSISTEISGLCDLILTLHEDDLDEVFGIVLAVQSPPDDISQ